MGDMSDVQLVRVVGPVISQVDQLEAALADMVSSVTRAMEVLSARVDAIETREVPAPVVNVSPARVTVPKALTEDDIKAIADAVRIPEDLLARLSAGNGPGGGRSFVAGGGRRDIRDFYGAGELLTATTSTTATLTLTQKAEEWWFRADGGTGYVDPFGGTADTNAIPLDDGVWLPINCKTASVSVHAPSGVTVTGFVLRYLDGA